MKSLAIFTVPEPATTVELTHDSGPAFLGVPGEADGRPAHLLPLADTLPDGHGAWLAMTWKDGTALKQHGVLWLSRGQRAEFVGDVFEKPKSFR